MTFGQMRLFLREGTRINAKREARAARLTRAAMWGSPEDFETQMRTLEG